MPPRFTPYYRLRIIQGFKTLLDYETETEIEAIDLMRDKEIIRRFGTEIEARIDYHFERDASTLVKVCAPQVMWSPTP